MNIRDVGSGTLVRSAACLNAVVPCTVVKMLYMNKSCILFCTHNVLKFRKHFMLANFTNIKSLISSGNLIIRTVMRWSVPNICELCVTKDVNVEPFSHVYYRTAYHNTI